MKKTTHLKRPAPFRSPRAVATMVLVAIAGVVVLVAAFAAGSYSSAETESGTVTGGATVVDDSNASGGQAVKFASAATPTPTPAPTATPTPPPGSTCTNPTHTLPLNPNNAQDGITLSGYYVDTDTWNYAKYPSLQQTMYVCDYNNWYAMVNANDNANNGEVKTYPNVHKDFSEPRLSSFTTVTSSFAHTAPSYGDWDEAYDIWINNYGVELMIWTQSNGRQAHVPGIPQVATTTLSGITYNIHKSGAYIAYDMPTTRTSGTLNLKEIFNDMVSRGYITNTATLSSIQYGVEVCNTNSINTRFELNNFSVTSQ